MALPAGYQLGAYEIVCPLGAGGMGEVYRARDPKLGRDVALKVLPPEVTKEPGRLERFDREARAIAALNHPHIVTIYSTEEADGIRFLTMELVDGHTLGELIVPSGMAIARFLDIAIPMADALAAAHQKQITHRDLKPGNVMVSHDGRVKVLDFGLARVGGGDAGEQTLIATAAPITHHGTVIGTMPYMSPEQVEGRPLDARSDLFSLGVIFYELLSGTRPFKGSSSPALMSAILRDTPPALADRRADTPEALDRLITRLMEKKPEDRVQTARDVFNELRLVKRQLESGSSSTIRRPSDRSALLSVRVRPFTARSSGDDVGELAAALPDEIANGLARFGYLRVLSGENPPGQSRYSLEGQIRKSASSVRISVKLLNSAGGDTLWSQNFDRPATHDFFELQDDIANRVITTVGDPAGVLARAMLAALADVPIDQLNVAELVIRYHAYTERFNAEEHGLLRDAFEQALQREPRAAEGWACLAQLYRHEHSHDYNPLPDPLPRQRRAATRAIEIDPNSQLAWVALASAHLFARDGAGVRVAVDRAVELNPLNAVALSLCALYLACVGDHDRGVAIAQRALELKPQHPGWIHIPALTRHFVRGEYEDALRAAKSVNLARFVFGQVIEAATAGLLDKADEARTALRTIQEHTPAQLDPDRARESFAKWIWDESFVDRVDEGFRKALALVGDDLGAERVPSSASGSRAKPPSSPSSTSSSRGGALSVAVLPFVARSSDEDSKSLADGLTDDITSGLSRFGYLRVLSRSISERLAREHTQVHTQARYAIEGHVRKSGSTVRVGVTLVDTQSGTNLWTQTYDRELSNGAFAVQDAVSSAVVATIGDQTGVLMRAMAAALADRPIEQLSVAELVVRYHLYTENFRPDEHLRLREAFERALEREPRAAEGWACLALLYEQEHGFGFNRQPDTQKRQRHAAELATEIDPRSQLAWVAMVSMLSFERDLEGIKAAADRAVSLNPLNADMTALVALFLVLPGEYDRSEALIQRALSLKAHHPGWYYFPTFSIHYQRKEYDKALREAKAMNIPLHPFAHLGAAAVSGQLGRLTEARAAIDALRQINAALVEPEVARRFWSVWIWREETVDHLVEGLIKARDLIRAADSGPADQASIAVLPFADLSEKKDQDWFCDGIAEEILNALAPLPGLRVAARASAFSFRGKTDDLRAIADKLNVTTVLEGSVRRAGDRVRISTQLSDAREGRQLWSERFDRELKDIFDVQEEIARAIAERLRVTLGDGGRRLVARATTNIEAYQLLLKGRMLLTRRGRAIVDAIPCFEKVIALDPAISDAHALLGDTYRLLGLYGLRPARETMPLARATLERALAIDPNQVEALATLANISQIYEWDFAAARALSSRALAVDPDHVRTLAERSIALAVADVVPAELQDEVLGRVARARALDPLNAWVMSVEAFCFAFVGRLDQAVAAATEAVALDPSNFTARWALVWTLAWVERFDDAEAAARPALEMSARHPMLLTELAAIHAARGDVSAAESIYQELEARAKSGYVGFGCRAAAAASAGRLDAARALVANAITERDSYLTFWKLPAWRPFWKDAEGTAILRATTLFSQ